MPGTPSQPIILVGLLCNTVAAGFVELVQVTQRDASMLLPRRSCRVQQRCVNRNCAEERQKHEVHRTQLTSLMSIYRCSFRPGERDAGDRHSPATSELHVLAGITTSTHPHGDAPALHAPWQSCGERPTRSGLLVVTASFFSSCLQSPKCSCELPFFECLLQE